MSHDLDMIDGEANAMFARVAWHQLGQVVGKAFTFEQAEAEGLDIAQPVQKVAMGDLILALESQPDEFAAVRGTRVLATGLGEQWTPFQVREAYELGQCIREQNGAGDLLSLGAIDRGRKWFLTYDLGEFSIGDYRISDYLSMTGSFDSSWKLSVISSPIVQVCANTIAAAKAAGTAYFTFKHTSGIHDRVKAAQAALVKHRAISAAFQRTGEALLATRVTSTDYSNLLHALFPITEETPKRTANVHQEAQEAVTALYKGAGGFVDSVGNGWSVVQAVNTWENWGAPVRKTQGRTESETRALRQVDQLVSNAQPFTDKAFALVGAMN